MRSFKMRGIIPKQNYPISARMIILNFRCKKYAVNDEESRNFRSKMISFPFLVLRFTQ